MIVHECVPVEENAAPFRKYECTSGIVRNKVILKNPRIELKQLVKELNVYAPNGHGKSKVLENKKRSDFLNDINKMVLITGGLALFCYEINIYDNEDTIATFATDGAVFYDKSNKLLYLSNGREDLLPKYWGILPENKCR